MTRQPAHPAPVGSRPAADLIADSAMGDPTMHEAETGVRAVFTGVCEAWEAGDANAFAAFYAPSATATIPGFQLSGADGVRTAMAAAFAGALHGTGRVHDIRALRFLDPGTAVVLARSGTRRPGQDAVPHDGWSWSTTTLSRRSGAWLIEAYHDCPEGGA